MKTIAKVFLILSLLAVLLGGFDIMSTNTEIDSDTSNSPTVMQIGIVAPVSAATCPDGRGGC
jgi:hypothetical protein